MKSSAKASKTVRQAHADDGRNAFRILRVEMARRQMNYADLTERLAENGWTENERSLRNKVARGTFSAEFFLACLKAIGVNSIDV